MSTVIWTFCTNVGNSQDACSTNGHFAQMSVTGNMPVPQLLVVENGVDKTQKPVYITQAFRFYLMAQS
ncbi:MAG: hypothetical protein JGK24_25860 [Microcoleus sp. PH2017_29_MFU_D_A]|jgi:hypothetical protein|uniref:hypothetical protein n=1 Tax=unclassified Microcoleus TaxID=2642155 RepID=UPI001D3258D5|nr:MULTISPECIES: hypothetical protein [unclassified Microcoleus]MCC3420346.1 hypothetical protein [Microcoleus sp. PH2017_07_MST_O_A]MCC3431593.1 hypothetical protein [Microcoleus sp. PH2017_04_SCI_O_A]MCC3442731.1 hypothetical protein [Microcoleus sp. PH2017_03_ELD_O_A]MCC3469160.1 hypothetical protein [Microcoleus sp. PH2017_06_SFM_O_A]MCC3505805.1 hypothetical protein [Microcoleus sp. PH2017_19_SFW_U_A]MCC3512008.1 hypothetical protein [Microcoleus sp. PH2017_17_BER_D_A]TAE07046.1 MAG: hy